MLHIIVKGRIVIVCLTATTVGCFGIITAAPASDAHFGLVHFFIKLIIKYVAF